MFQGLDFISLFPCYPIKQLLVNSVHSTIKIDPYLSRKVLDDNDAGILNNQYQGDVVPEKSQQEEEPKENDSTFTKSYKDNTRTFD